MIPIYTIKKVVTCDEVVGNTKPPPKYICVNFYNQK